MRPPILLALTLMVSCLASAAPPPAAFISAEPSLDLYRDGWIDFNKNGTKEVYEDSKAPVEQRISDLLGRMSLDEKTAQMATLYGYARVLRDELPTPQWQSALWKDGIGNIDEHSNGNTGAENPLPNPEYDFPWSMHRRQINEIQRWFIEKTRLGIPVDFTNEGIRGLLHTGATSFPSQLGVAATWNRPLVREIGRITGREARALGYTNVYSPILDLARDPRWGRTVETYGEDPFLVSELGLQQVLGIQEQGVVSTLKHFAVYSVPKGGRDGDARTDPHATWSEVQSVLLAPFRRAVRDGHALGVMASYNDYDGVPIEANRLFLQDILRGEYGFAGYVVSDSGAVEFLHEKHRVAATPEEAVLQAVSAGLNIRTNFTFPEAYVGPLRKLVAEGRLSEELIDSRVRDILRVKFWQGLFDHPYQVDPATSDRAVRTAAHLAAATRANREAIVLLKNERGALPVSPAVESILVTGPLADDDSAWWSRYAPQGLSFVTPLEGIRARFSGEVHYHQGVAAADESFPESDVFKEGMPAAVEASIAEAVALAKRVKLVIAVVGEPGRLSRESVSRVSLDLPGYQSELVRALHATGVPLIVVLSSGRPMSANFEKKHVDAILSIGYLGEAGGTALAEVLAGDYNPAGRLPITMPRSVGQIPFNFPFKPGSQAKDEGQVEGPLYPFGHGLSYSQFEYSDPRITPARPTVDQSVTVEAEVKNTSAMDGEEVVQLYLRDDFSSVTTYERVLRGFERVSIPAGQTRRVAFELAPSSFALYGADRRWVVEPGRFTVMLGASSADLRSSGTFTVVDSQGRAPEEPPLAAPLANAARSE